ncbi:hypothetical protein [Blautia marasmi]|uniref:hypothetical protein n=1 Tax=Blautia marasmi TaxID=1917868 RepID=UPI003517CC6D
MGSLQIIKDDIVLDFYSSSMETVYAKQSDTGRVLKISLQEAGKEYQIPSGVTARISCGTFWNECTIQDNKVVAPLSSDMLYSGRRPCQIELMMGEDKVSTANFILYTEASARDDNAIMGSNKYGVLDGLIDKAFNDAEQTGKDAAQTAADRKATGADRTAVAADRKTVEKINNDFTLTAQQATADVNNAGQTQTQRVNTAGDTQVSRVQAEGTTQVQNVQATAAEIAEDREQIHTNRDNTARLQRTAAGAITRSAEGSFVTLEDAADEMGFRRIEIEGETRQVTTTGAQMIDFEQCLKNWKSQYTQVGGRVYKITAIGSGYQAPVAFSENDIKVTLSGIIRDLSGSGYRVDLIDSSGNIVGRINKDIKSITGLASKIRLNFAEAGAGEYSDIMLNAGSAAIPWEPYTGSKPSPSPEYPQELENVGRQNTDGKYAVKVAACGKNIADFKPSSETTHYSGALCADAYLTPNTTYCISGFATVGNAYYANEKLFLRDAIVSEDNNGCFMIIATTLSDISINDPAQYIPGYGWRLLKNNKDNAAHNFSGLQMETGGTATEYAPYRGHTATITSDRPLTKWDKLTCRDGVWGWAYKGITVVEGGNREATGHFYPTIVLPPLTKKMDVNSEVLCNYCGSEYIGKSSNEGTNMCISNADTYWGFSSITDANAWLIQKNAEGNPLYYQYKTQEEEWIPLSPEEQAAMNALCTYAGTTHIWTDDPLQPVISLDYTVDTETYIKDTTPAYRDVERFALTGEASGAVATCTDSADWPLLGIGMLGKCEQLTTTGANLFGGRALADKIMEVAPEIQETGMYNPETGMYEADVVMMGAQLFDLEQWLKQVKVEYAKDNSGITITGSGGIYANPMSFAKTDIEVTLSGKLEVLAGTNYRFELLDQNMNVVGSFFSGSKPITAIASKIRMNYYNIGKCRISDIMINKGSTALPWEPYKGMQSLPLTADQPWRGTGDVHDEVCDRDGVLGTWRRYATTVYNTAAPSEDDILAQTKGIRIKAPKDALYNGKILCDKFTREEAWGNDKLYIFNYGGGAAREIAFRVAVGENKDTFFVDNPIKLIYQLAEPYFVPFPEEIQRAYRKLKSYAGTTHAWVDDPLQPEVSFRYVKDSKLILGKLEDRLTALEAGQAQTAAAFGYLPANIQAEMIENETNQLMDSI